MKSEAAPGVGVVDLAVVFSAGAVVAADFSVGLVGSVAALWVGTADLAAAGAEVAALAAVSASLDETSPHVMEVEQGCLPSRVRRRVGQTRHLCAAGPILYSALALILACLSLVGLGWLLWGC